MKVPGYNVFLFPEAWRALSYLSFQERLYSVFFFSVRRCITIVTSLPSFLGPATPKT